MMSVVTIDGENVEFDGPAPSTCSEALGLIEGFLSSQGRLIRSISVDGDVVSLEAASELGGYELLALETTTPEQQLLDMCELWAGQCSSAASRSSELAVSVLKKPWRESQSAVVNFLEDQRGLLEGLGIVQGFGGETSAVWAERFGQCFSNTVSAIDVIADSVEKRSPAALSDALGLGSAASWRSVSDILLQVLIPEMKGRLAT